MKVIIAGSRNFHDYPLLRGELNCLLIRSKISEIVSGCADGADKLGEHYAKEYGIKIKRFPADWLTHGKKAGYMRNKQMAEYATHCVCFWDGESKGTALMIKLAKEYNLILQIVKY